MTRIVAGVLLCFAGSFGFMACGAPPEEESVGSVAEPAVLLKPPKHFSGEPEYPVEGRPQLDLPPPGVVEPSDPGPAGEPFEPPTLEPPEEPGEPTRVDPSEHGNPHRESTGNHGGPEHGGPGAGGFQHPAAPGDSVHCASPADCVDKCSARAMYCMAEHAVHPSKADLVGDLIECADTSIPASRGGSYWCKYEYRNGDVCVWMRASRLGPFHLPAPPPLCVYKTN
jgi:hypothetical protein